jgi:hypothetical protein
VVRRGESEKEVIIPLRGAQKTGESEAGEPPRKVYKVDSPPAAGAGNAGVKSDPDSHGPLPLS